MRATDLLLHAQRLQALAQAGIAYANTPYDLERYAEIRDLSVKILQQVTDTPYERLFSVFASEKGYQTPKVDVRAVMFRGQREILLVREKLDQNRWTLPGGWADVGYTPAEVAVKEVWEEAGLTVKATRLLGLLDKRNHEHPPQPWYVYKAFLECEIMGGELLQETTETGGAQWFSATEIASIPLSTDRVTAAQLDRLFRYAVDHGLPAMFD